MFELSPHLYSVSFFRGGLSVLPLFLIFWRRCLVSCRRRTHHHQERKKKEWNSPPPSSCLFSFSRRNIFFYLSTRAFEKKIDYLCFKKEMEKKTLLNQCYNNILDRAKMSEKNNICATSDRITSSGIPNFSKYFIWSCKPDIIKKRVFVFHKKSRKGRMQVVLLKIFFRRIYINRSATTIFFIWRNACA